MAEKNIKYTFKQYLLRKVFGNLGAFVPLTGVMIEFEKIFKKAED